MSATPRSHFISAEVIRIEVLEVHIGRDDDRRAAGLGFSALFEALIPLFLGDASSLLHNLLGHEDLGSGAKRQGDGV